MSGPRKRRKQRQDRWLEKQVDNALEGQQEGSHGQFWVLNLDTWEKTPGLNLQEAKELWRSLPRANYFTMDTWDKKPAPGRGVFDGGKLPQ